MTKKYIITVLGFILACNQANGMSALRRFAPAALVSTIYGASLNKPVMSGGALAPEYKDINDVVTRCSRLPGQTYEEACGGWIDKFKSQINPTYDPLLTAVLLDNAEAVNALAQRRASVGSVRKSEDGFGREAKYIPLHLARGKDVIEALAKHGADINYKTDYSSTPLHVAVNDNDLKKVEVLLALGANPTLTNSGNRTPLDMAKDSYKLNAWKNKDKYKKLVLLLEKSTAEYKKKQARSSLFSRCYWSTRYCK